MNKPLISFLHRLLLTLMVLCLGINVYAEDTEVYTLVKDASWLKDGAKVLIVNIEYKKALQNIQYNNTTTNAYRGAVSITINSDSTVSTSTLPNSAKVLTLIEGTKGWYFYTDSAYLGAKSSGNCLMTRSRTTETENFTKATISISTTQNYNATIKFSEGNSTIIRYNYTYNRFSCYSGDSQKPVQLYHLVKIPTTTFAKSSADVLLGSTYTQTATTTRTSKITYTSSDETIATVDANGVVTPIKSGSVTITASTAENSDYAASTASYKLNVRYAADTETSSAIFYESFNTNTGTGGNDGSWSGSIASKTLYTDNDGWSITKGSGANACAKIGTEGEKGIATTPAIGKAGDFILTFKAGAWAGDGTTLVVKTNEGELSMTGVTANDSLCVTLTDSKFTDYCIVLSGATVSTQITFQSKNKTNNVFFLDEVKIVEVVSNRYEGNSTVTKSMITAAPDVVDNALTVIKTKDSSIIPDEIKNATNVIVGNESTYTAKKIVLTDKKDYYAPFGFTAEALTYSRSNTQGFNTVCLPFDFNVNDAKKLFGEDAKVYALTGVENASGSGTSLTFGDAAGTIKAGTPCLIYNETTTDWNITLENVVMNGTSSEESVTPSEDGVTCNFTGSYQAQTLGEGYYKLNSTGSKFVTTTESSTIKPFRAYLKIQ